MFLWFVYHVVDSFVDAFLQHKNKFMQNISSMSMKAKSFYLQASSFAWCLLNIYGIIHFNASDAKNSSKAKHWYVNINKHYPKMDFCWKKIFLSKDTEKSYVHARNDFSFIGFSFITFCIHTASRSSFVFLTRSLSFFSAFEKYAFIICLCCFLGENIQSTIRKF